MYLDREAKSNFIPKFMKNQKEAPESALTHAWFRLI
jgi:hypothetical protein